MSKSTFVVSVEQWHKNGDPKNEGRVKIAVRAAKGSTVQKPGTFHGATNFKTR